MAQGIGEVDAPGLRFGTTAADIEPVAAAGSTAPGHPASTPKIGLAPWVNPARPGERYYPHGTPHSTAELCPLVAARCAARDRARGHSKNAHLAGDKVSRPPARVPTRIIGAARHARHRWAAVARIGSVTDRYLTAHSDATVPAGDEAHGSPTAVGAENSVMSCDLQILVYQATEPVSS